jgi:hypothetical protein
MSTVHFGLGILNLSREFIGQIQTTNDSSWLRSRASTLVAVLPILLVFGYVQWTYYNGTQSFTAPLELIGALLTPVLAGIIPVLLLVASRKKNGETTKTAVCSAASQPVILTAIVCLSFAGLLFHGFVLWENPVAQACALFVTTTMFVLILDQGRRGLFSSSPFVEFSQVQWRSLPVSKVQYKKDSLRNSVRN